MRYQSLILLVWISLSLPVQVGCDGCDCNLEGIDLRWSRWWSSRSSDLISYVLGRMVVVVLCFLCCFHYEKVLPWYGEDSGAQYGRAVRSAPPVRVPTKSSAAPGWNWSLKEMYLFRCNQLINILGSSVNDDFLKYIIKSKVSSGLWY
jgi:hypothetical protein